MKKIQVLIALIALLIGLQSIPVLAQSYSFKEDSGVGQTAKEAGYDTNKPEIETRISQLINIVLSVLGVLFLILIIYGGVIWMTAAGNEEKAKKAKELITEAVIGLIIVLAAYAITFFVVNRLIGPSLSNNPSALPSTTNNP